MTNTIKRSLNTTINLLVNNYLKQQKDYKSTNLIVIKLCKIALSINPTAQLTHSRHRIDRGSLVEQLADIILNNNTTQKVFKKSQKDTDIIYNGLPYEVKFIGCKNYATYHENQNLDNVIIIDKLGFHEVHDKKNIILDKCKKHIKGYKNDKLILSL